MRKKVEKNTTAKKTVEKKTVSAVKAVEPEVKVEENTEAEAAEAVSEEKPESEAEAVSEEEPEVKAETAGEEKPAAKTAAKKTAKSATTAKKTTKTAAKKETEEKPAKTTKSAKAAASQKVILQMSGREELSVENIINRVKDAYVAEGHSAASIKNVEVYIKPEESMAYYVIDGYASGISLY